MCGRFTLRTNWARIARYFELQGWEERQPRFNIAPESEIACIRRNAEDGSRELVALHWGLIPSWAKDPTVGRKLINARAESITEKPSFRNAFRARRCLVLADGFYEWKADGKRKIPYYIRLQEDRPFAFAGLWESWKNNGLELQSCTIVTTEANELLKTLHHRMPVILPLEQYDNWLDPSPGDENLLRPYPSGEMTLHPVSDVVNRAALDTPECIEPVSRIVQKTLFD